MKVFPIVRVVGGTMLATWVALWFGAPLVALLDAQIPFRFTLDLRWLGWLILAGAFALIASAQIAFVKIGGATGVPGDAPRALVVRGIYRWVRNPLYIAGNALLWGNALVFASVGLLVLACISGIMFHLFVVFVEEPRLEKKYGAAYRAYKKNVPRWMPRLPREIC